MAEGVSAPILDRYLPEIEYLPSIIKLDQQQPESIQSFSQYYSNHAPRSRIRLAFKYYQQYHDLLAKIEAKYGVPANIIIALWAMESDFGRQQGSTPTLSALATLSYEGRREEFFRRELITAFTLLEAGKIKVDDLNGSWAGAIGQCQFMPTSYAEAAVDWDGDGQADIWNSKADVFASIARLLQLKGWQADEAWGARIQLPPDFDHSLIQNNTIMPNSAWHPLGIKLQDGNSLPVSNLSGMILQPYGPSGQSFLVYNNYRVILSWNRSNNFALTTALLAEQIEELWQAQQ